MSIVVAVKKDGKIGIAADEGENFGDGVIFDRSNSYANKITKFSINGINGKPHISYIGICGEPAHELAFKDFLLRNQNIGLFDNRINIYRNFQLYHRKLKEDYGKEDNQNIRNDTIFMNLDADFIIVNEYGIFHIDQHCHVVELQEYFAIGIGWELAVGALAVMYGNPRINAYELARDATQIAIRHNKYCFGKINLIEVC